MTFAAKIKPEAVEPQTEKRIYEALSAAKDEARSNLRPNYRTGFKVLGFGLALFAFGSLVQEVERQRRKIEKMESDYEAVVAFTMVLIEETDCGKKAYVEAGQRADDEDFTADWSGEDDEPIPHELVEPTHDEHV